MSGFDRFAATFLDLDVAQRYAPEMLAGLVTTIVIGAAVAVLRSFGLRLVNTLMIQIVDILRALPPLVVILIIYFGLPNIGIVIPSAVVLWLSLSAILAAFSEEVFLAAI